MIIYWNRNLAGTHRGQNFMIKGQKFLQWYLSGRNIITGITGVMCVAFSSTAPGVAVTESAPGVAVTSSKPGITFSDGGNCS